MNKKITIALISIFSVIIICGAVFAFQENGQVKQNNKSPLDEFGDNGFRSAPSDENYEEKEPINYSVLATLVDIDGGNNGENNNSEKNNKNKKQKFSVAQSLNFVAETGKDLFETEKEKIFQLINKTIKFRERIEVSKIIKVPEDYKTIQSAIDGANFGDTVKVSAGEYKENIVMREGVNLIGSNIFKKEIKEETEKTGEEKINFDDLEFNSASPIGRIIINETIINGGNSGNVVSFKNGITNKTKLSNFTIKNAGENLSGIFIEDSSPLITDNLITDNEYNIYIKGNSSPTIQKNSLRFGEKGIQIYNFKEKKQEDSDQEIEASEEDYNIEKEKQESSSQEIETNEVEIEDNEVYNFASAPNIIDNLITDNKIGIDLYQSSALIDHNTISYNNHYKIYLGATFGIYIHNSSAKISNNIITDSGICDLCAGVNADEKSKNIILSYNNIWNSKNNFVCFGECVAEDNNVSEEPLFIDPANWNFELQEESGLIGKGEEKSDLGVRW